MSGTVRINIPAAAVSRDCSEMLLFTAIAVEGVEGGIGTDGRTIQPVAIDAADGVFEQAQIFFDGL